MAPEAGAVLARRRFTPEEFHRMGDVGILDDNERVELIEGEIVEMTPIGPPHASVVTRLAVFFAARLSGRMIPWVQNPVLLRPQRSEPQPDLVLLRPKPDFYATGHPEPSDMLLVIEVMDSSAPYDRRVKLPLYARAGIVEVWLVDLPARTVEAYRRPTPRGYAERQILAGSGEVAPAAFPDFGLTLSDIFG